jgi:hypothetical protein
MTARICALLCLFICLLTVGVWAKSKAVPPLPDRNPARPEKAAEQKPLLPKDAPTVPWTEVEIAAAKADCSKLLADEAIDYEPLPPLKEGLCGAPAPIRVRSIGSDPEKVVLDPPATLRCQMARTLAAWLKKTVQPFAKELLGSPVAKLKNGASYVCRNRYNGTHTLISEHALANAIDLSEFVLASGETVSVLDNWPKIVTASTPPLPLRKPAPPKSPVIKASAIKAAPPRTSEVPNRRRIKAAPLPKPERPSLAAKSSFLWLLHDTACDQFGTVLGPESNDAHKNHFHLDEKARRRKNFCE